jgi:protocatechuate 3,4-dioxygenase, beta subunit
MNHTCLCLVAVLISSMFTCCNGQDSNSNKQATGKNQLVGGGCDGCELMYAGMPASIDWIDTSAGWNEKGKRLLLMGTVYKKDKKTPAPNVILYYWHTDNTGHYSPAENMNNHAKRHGHLRGWVKTDSQGKYAIYTIRPVAYPNTDIAAHIHFSIKEPAIENEYYIDELVFDDDPLLTAAKRKNMENRGGNGVLKLNTENGILVADHDIILGLNIPGYPE